MFFSNTKDTKYILELLEQFESYIKGDLNSLQFQEHSTKDKNLNLIAKKVVHIAKALEQEKEEDLKVFGEIMLVCEKLSDGYTNDFITQKTSDEKLNYVSYSINEAVKNIQVSLNEVTQILHQYEKNDYRNSVNENLFRGGQFKELLQGINNLQKGITNRVLDSYKIGMTMEHQANILQVEVNTLSNSTNQQAAAVEETAAAVEEITETINSNTHAAIEMLESGEILKNSASKSMTLTNLTKNAMNSIDKSTQAVYEAASVISQIAFQTNILSLNAAVEAATAGEAGKGFAVVAQEVRNLANRSADVANTISTLMDELKVETEKGKKSSDSMESEFLILNTNINDTLRLLDQIVNASKEQKASITQINQAIQHIDQATQENASSTQNVHDIAIQTYNVANTLVNSNKDVNFEGKDALGTPDEIIKSIFTNKKIY
ncbi:MAG: methyl-accepting chemotaxis protein [Arcobacteraceae bacterium]|jgi:methyl-accepting chemotaxis protein|nr:methyl-accepting chemotaxis protein [Arcobacteraceae bacterium]